MPQARGSQATFALYEESSYATDPGTPDGQKLYLTSFNLQKAQPRNPSNTLTNSRARAEGALGNADISGDIAMEIGAESMGALLKHAIGTVSTTGTGPYSHVITIGDLPTSLLLEPDYGSAISGSGRYVKYNGCRIGQAAFSFPTEGYPTATFSMVGAKAVLDSSPLDATLTDNGHTSFSAFDAAIEEGGSAIATVKRVDFTLDNELDTDGYVIGGSGQRQQLPEGFSTISGNLTAIFDSTALMNKALNGTETSLKLTLSRGDGLGSAGNESIEFLIQQMKYDPTTPPIDGPGGIVITLPFQAYKSGANLGLQVTLKNNVATI